MSGPRPRPARVIATILAKDLRVELRTLQSVPAMVLFATTIFVIFRFGLDRDAARRQPRRRRPAGHDPVRGAARDQPPLRRRARAGRLRGDPPRPGRRHRAVRRQGRGAASSTCVALELIAVPVFGSSSSTTWAGLPPLLRGPAAARPRPRRDRRADLLDRDQLARPRPARAADPAAAAGPADDRRGRRRPSRCSAAGGPDYDDFGTWLAVLALYDLIFLLIGYAVFDFLLED